MGQEWALEPASSRFISFSACFCISAVVTGGPLRGFIEIMPVKHLNTERETVLNMSVRCHWFYTSLWRGGCLGLPWAGSGAGGRIKEGKMCHMEEGGLRGRAARASETGLLAGFSRSWA